MNGQFDLVISETRRARQVSNLQLDRYERLT
ncbi:hypothetical protein J2R87_006627 [Bradyrhizobium elkanii]|nr:hypothetical protein [Bradyrhizobium elkanii]MCS4105605.1 hypothetical protein [Bradyrhizobium elkanii]